MVEQAGVIPYRRRDGQVQVLLITSRSSGRWIIPKGMIDPGHTPEQAALQEAFEEAGVHGHLDPELGRYYYIKWGRRMEVRVFPMMVVRQLDSWEEEDSRKRRWFPARQAAAQVQERELADLLETFASSTC